MDGHHKYLFDEENLVNTLLTTGFKHVQLRQFDSNLDLKERDHESIYVLAKKSNFRINNITIRIFSLKKSCITQEI